MNGLRINRRRLILGAGALGGLLTAGCDRLTQAPSFQRFIGSAQGLSFGAQRLLLTGQPLAREFSARDISPWFKPNGSTEVSDPDYLNHLQAGFADWKLRVDGLVSHPLDLSLAELKALPARTQITRHDCVEGWSAIGKWTGVPLSLVLKAAGLSPRARFVVFHCADDLDNSTDGSGRYYESIDLIDALHPQTILAYGMNGRHLPIAHGAPVRLRVETQLGYKSVKYVRRIIVKDAFDDLGRLGDIPNGWSWYAGI
jgi:DMSO/TMAO reductase YedYZ molybdopterin-dependent catalytic subunit